MGEDVVLVPGELLGQEPPDPAQSHDLREGGRIAEDIGQPHIIGLDPAFIEVEALAVHDLTDERLTRRDVAIGLHPHASGGFEPALVYAFLEPLPQVGVVLGHPGQMLGLGHDEAVLRIPVHQGQNCAERRRALPDRLAQWPQPGRVEVGVAHDAHGVRLRCAGGVEQLLEQGLDRAPAVGEIGEFEQVAGSLEPGSQPRHVRLFVRQLRHQLDEDAEGVEELVEFRVPDVEVGLLEGEQRSTLGLRQQQRPGIGPERRGWIGRRLHEQLDDLTAGGTAGEEVFTVIG